MPNVKKIFIKYMKFEVSRNYKIKIKRFAIAKAADIMTSRLLKKFDNELTFSK
jgi:hypothetical protein